MAKSNKTFESDHSDGFSILKFKELLVAAITAMVFLCGVAWGFYEFMKAETALQERNKSKIVQHNEQIQFNQDQITDLKEDMMAKADKWQLEQHLHQDEREKDHIWRELEKKP